MDGKICVKRAPLCTVLMMRRVVVTGMGMVSPLGVGVQRSWGRLLAGENGFVATKTLGLGGFESVPAKVVGKVPEGSGAGCWAAEAHVDASLLRRSSLFSQYAIAAADEALEDAKWNPTLQSELEATGVIIGSGIGGVCDTYDMSVALDRFGYKKMSPMFVPKMLPNMAAGLVSIMKGFQGPINSVSTACATGNNAIGDSYNLIKYGEAQVMVAGATDAAIHPLSLSGFARAKSLANGDEDSPGLASRPFDVDRNGFVLSEGAGVLVLEELDHAKKRNAPIYAEIVGYGTSADAYHITAPSPEGRGAIKSMKQALRGVDLAKVGYINAHATSTVIGDEIESKAIYEIFKDTNPNINVSSTKGSIGHLLGAAGAVESIFTILSIKTSTLPFNLNLNQVGVTITDGDKEVQLNYIKDEPLKFETEYALTNSFGFGGFNASLVFKRFQE